jgi:hypothetical protein
MSYDIVIVVPPIPDRDSEAWGKLDLENSLHM